ncbi:DUF1120 domain-containing protein [Pseudomonas sp. SWRI103]|uniref:DUF1120 domain-containing protein n=2 Tax=Pseudomonas TaxID=286 RepID=A0ABS6NS86_9PSED|nr:DUF1120 domain-containing protein [Pseudomonas azadiae]NMF40311.1 DUF1120 domain-containing protein [Pseudomonas sp. SWRI 103]
MLGTLLLGAASSAFTASSVDLSVKGSITPSACEPSLSDGGIYDLGKIAARDLNKDQPTALPFHRLQLTVSCEASTLVALAPGDNRLGSSSDSAASFKFGLGLINTHEKLGNFFLNIESVLADGVAAHPLGSAYSNWSPTSLMSHHFITAVTTDKTTQTPSPYKQMTAYLLISPTVAPAATLTLTEQVPIDGSVTLTLLYL